MWLFLSRVDTTRGTLLCKQEGVFRVNCMDCLDRTNVIQTLIAQNVLQTAVSNSECRVSSTLLPFVFNGCE